MIFQEGSENLRCQFCKFQKPKSQTRKPLANLQVEKDKSEKEICFCRELNNLRNVVPLPGNRTRAFSQVSFTLICLTYSSIINVHELKTHGEGPWGFWHFFGWEGPWVFEIFWGGYTFLGFYCIFSNKFNKKIWREGPLLSHSPSSPLDIFVPDGIGLTRYSSKL